jgi:circadian clock protein KaiC
VLTGSLRLAQEAHERTDAVSRQQEIERKGRELDRKRLALEAQIAALRAGYEAEEEELQRSLREAQLREQVITDDRLAMGKSRHGDPEKNTPSHNRRNASTGGRK